MVDEGTVDRAVKLTADVAKRDEALPDIADVKALPGARVVMDAEGTGYTVHVPKGDSVRGFDEMLRPWRRRAADVGLKAHEGTPEVQMTTWMGDQRTVPAGAERRLYAAGFRARLRGKRRRLAGAPDDPNGKLRTRTEIAGLE